jgi:6,7-dimethyl-8-ribityllumazine synthase
MKKILIIQATFYAKISKLLLEGAVKKIEEAGREYEIVTVPGALEIPTVIAFAEEEKNMLATLLLAA